MTEHNQPELSIVIPAYNEEEAIGPLLDEVFETLAAMKISHEVIVVDDGSTDGTSTLLHRRRETTPDLRVLTLVPRSGQSAAFEAGFQIARGQLIVTMDGDGQNDPADIPNLVASIADHDAVLGVRAHRQDPGIRKVAQKIANTVRNRLLGGQFRDVGCSLKVFRRGVIEDLNLYDGLHRFFPYLVEMQGGKTLEVEVGHRPRRLGKSKYSPLGRGVPAFLDLLMVKRMKKRALRYHVEERT